MTLIAAVLALVLQNPEDPYLEVPEGWRVRYERTSIGKATGPDGQELSFSGYHATGQVANVYYELEPDSLPVRAVVGCWEVIVTVCPDDKIAVSYQKREDSSYGGPFDYWMKARSVREAVQLMSVCLTRPAVMLKHYPRDAELPAPQTNWGKASERYPFPGLGAGNRTPFRLERMAFELLSGDTVTMSGEPPKDMKWQERATVLDTTLVVSEDASGKVWVVRTGGGAPRAVASTSSPKVAPTVLAMLAALTYRETNGSPFAQPN